MNRYGYVTNVNHIIGQDGKTLPVTSDNPLAVNVVPTDEFPTTVVSPGNVLSTENSTTTPLGIGGVFLGSSVDVLGYSTITISLFANVSSATLGLQFEFSIDNVNWYVTDEYTYVNTTMKTYSIQTVAQYFRVRYTNGSVAQTTFQLTVALNAMAGVASSHRIGDTISNEDDAQLTKSVLSAEKPTGDQINITATPEGDLKTSVVTPTGTLPVSQLTTLHDGKVLGRLFPEINEIAGTGTATFQDNKTNMSVTAGQWNVHQSRRFYPYFSGKPQKVEMTFDHFAPEANVIKRVGYFSSNVASPFDADYDGFYLESGNGTIKFVLKNASTTVSEVDITNWTRYDVVANYQNLAEWDNFTVIEFNFLWLGGAYIELRLVTENGFATVHNFVYAGTSQDVFTKSPNQPVRYEIRSTTGTGTFRYICNQVATSGSISESAISKAVNTGTTPINLPTAGITYPIIAVRKQSTALRMNPVRVSSAGLFVTSLDRILWTLEINPTLSAPLTYTPVTNSSFSYASGNGAITVTGAGIVIANGYITENDAIASSLFVNNYLSWLSGQLDGTQDQYVLCATPITTNVNIHGSMTLLEG